MKAQIIESGAEQQAGSVVILYESLDSREQAAGVSEKFAGLNVNWYAFEDLNVSPAKEEAAEAAAEADVLAVAVGSAGDLPPTVKLWMESWLRRRGQREGLLVGLLSDERAQVRGVAGLKEMYLRHLAHRAGMNFLTHFPEDIRKVMPDSLDSFIQRAERVTPLLDDILHKHWIMAAPPLK